MQYAVALGRQDSWNGKEWPVGRPGSGHRSARQRPWSKGDSHFFIFSAGFGL